MDCSFTWKCLHLHPKLDSYTYGHTKIPTGLNPLSSGFFIHTCSSLIVIHWFFLLFVRNLEVSIKTCVSKTSQVSMARDGVYKADNSTVWTSDDAKDPQASPCVVANIGPSGYFVLETPEMSPTGNLLWPTLSASFINFVQFCLLSTSTVGGRKISQFYSSSVYRTRQNDIHCINYTDIDTAAWGECRICF